MKKEIRDLLEKPFDKKFIKQRPGSFGKTLDYVEADKVIQRLNNIFDSRWSVEILTKPHEALINNSVVVGVRLTVPNLVEIDGKTVQDGWVTKEAFGGKKITMSQDKVTKEYHPLDIASDMKSCMSDAIKKASTYLGIALDLYGDSIGEEDSDDAPKKASDKPTKAAAQSETEEVLSDNEPANAGQKAAIQNLVKKTGKNLDEVLKSLSIKDLDSVTKAQAGKVITSLQAK